MPLRLKPGGKGCWNATKKKLHLPTLIVKLIAIALRRHPRVNASWVNGTIQANPEINIGLAVAVEDGLLVPVIRNADRLGIQALAMKRKNLVTGASGQPAGAARPERWNIHGQ
jgi:pyruvate dehydrogenase E2 component (dihydrolipoamide acetyltransferase)